MLSLFPHLPRNHRQQTWGQLYGSSLAAAIAEYCHATSGIHLLIAPDNLKATQLMADIRFFLPDNDIELLLFPDWETLPYDRFSAHQDIISDRLTTLNRLRLTTKAIVITSVATIMHRLCPPSFLQHYCFLLDEGSSFDLARFKRQLEQTGYRSVNQVLEHGEYAQRGSIIDLYPMGSEAPLRIELFDNTIDSLRLFDPDTQRTTEKVSSIHILPAREFPLNDHGIALFRRQFRDAFSLDPTKCPLYESVIQHQYPAGIDYYLPLFFEKTATFFDYLTEDSSVILIENIPDKAQAFWDEANHRYDERAHDITRPILPPSRCFLTPTELLTHTKTFKRIRCFHDPIERKGIVAHANTQKLPSLTLTRHGEHPLEKLSDYVTQQPEARFLFVTESLGRREILESLLKEAGISPTIQPNFQAFLKDKTRFSLTIGSLAEGAELPLSQIIIIIEGELFGYTPTPLRTRTSKAIDPDTIIRSLAELEIDAPVVHRQFGVGRYHGLITLENQGALNEFLILTYAGNDKIYVPVTSLHLITRYSGGQNASAPLHKLGHDQWTKERKKASEKIHDVAIELLEIYAKRKAKQGFSHTIDRTLMDDFNRQFPFTETEDQKKAIQQIMLDMHQSQPMDRLICGDVGFGKTEVAMRAAFLAVQNNKQVCVLVPTTLLAGQHFETFSDRFANFPVRIELLSRFRTAKESNAVIENIKNGRVDIVIGTHKLLSKNLSFHQLGLLIIDEEHRFGVKQKEYIKSMRVNVDILSMTATPIPRTLNMALAGIRDISLIATPPAKRLAIKTFWSEKTPHLLREAILREIMRGGQVFFLHNNITTIEQVAEELKQLVPEALIQTAHGQMRERALEKIMSDFYHHRFNVLVCTTIIETGIDIPTANTILIDRADTLGLAQLHQLRGRVGRSHHQAYAYLLTPNEKAMTKDAVKRLEALTSLEDLGAGFTLATHDMEIRGAGELLGEDQSGNMHAIGFNLYMELLDKAVSDLQSGKVPELEISHAQGTDINLQISALLPNDYIADIHTRLIMYKRIANANDKTALDNLQAELIDRFGLLPQPTKQLFAVTRLKLTANQLGIEKIYRSGQSAHIVFSESPELNPAVLIQLIQKEPKKYKMQGSQVLQFTLDASEPLEQIHNIHTLLDRLSNFS